MKLNTYMKLKERIRDFLHDEKLKRKLYVIIFESDTPAGKLFDVAGAMVLWREWKAYQYAKAHKDDPDSWSQDDALPEQKRPATPAEQVGPEADQKGRDEE